MTDIDWLAVDMVCTGVRLKLRPDEKRMAMRRLAEKMLNPNELWGNGKLSAADVGELLGITDRHAKRLKDDLPPATKQTCPVCRQPMWVVSGVVEPHPTSLLEQCPMSDRRTMPGLAGLRPDLYQWAIA